MAGAQAVNAYVDTPRMTEDIDIMAIDGERVCNDLRSAPHDQFHIAVRVRSLAGDRGLRIEQVRKPENRHLVDVRQVDSLPPHQHINNLAIVTVGELIAPKIISMSARPHTLKGLTDEADLSRLLLKFPEVKSSGSPINGFLTRLGASQKALDVWENPKSREIRPDDTNEY